MSRAEFERMMAQDEQGVVPADTPCARTTGNVPPREVQLAVLLRLVQWHLDDVAHELPNGRVSADRRVELATALETLAVLVREDRSSV